MLLYQSHHNFISVVHDISSYGSENSKKEKSLWWQRGEDVILKVKGKLRKGWITFCQDTEQDGWSKYKSWINLVLWKNRQTDFFFSNLLYLYLISKAPLMIQSSGFGKLAENKKHFGFVLQEWTPTTWNLLLAREFLPLIMFPKASLRWLLINNRL